MAVESTLAVVSPDVGTEQLYFVGKRALICSYVMNFSNRQHWGAYTNWMFLSLHKILHGWFRNVLIHQGNVPKSKTTGKLCNYLGIMSNVGGSYVHSWRSPIWSSQIRVALNSETARGYFTHRFLMKNSHKWQKDNLFIYSKSWAIWWFHSGNRCRCQIINSKSQVIENWELFDHDTHD